MSLQLSDLAALDAPLSGDGRPLPLPIDAIDEDPAQPRREFDANALDELAATILDRGVRQPISVRPHPELAGRWVLNFGARRLRAARLAGLTEIPAFVDTTADDYDQVIENEQREGLKPLELALFVQKRLALGDNKAKIARKLGKSRQYLTFATALIEPPDWLLDVYRANRCRGFAELYELRRLHGEFPDRVEAWVSDGEVVTRDRIASFRNELTQAAAIEAESVGGQAVDPVAPAAPSEQRPGQPRLPYKPGAQRRFDQRLHVEFDGQDYQLVLSVAPAHEGQLYIRPLSGGPRRSAPASALKLRGFVGR